MTAMIYGHNGHKSSNTNIIFVKRKTQHKNRSLQCAKENNKKTETCGNKTLWADKTKLELQMTQDPFGEKKGHLKKKKYICQPLSTGVALLCFGVLRQPKA